MTKVLILCPTFDHCDTLSASIASVQTQSFKEWEMAVIDDGAPDRTFEILSAISAEDQRVKAYRHPKGDRHGESYRDPVIRASNAEFVCHLSDDDLWTPNHLASMVASLEQADWVNQAPLRLLPGRSADWRPVNHGTPQGREEARQRIGLSAGINYVGYRRDTYLRLPEGWTCAPKDAGSTDMFMWSKFFHYPELTVASSAETTAIKLPSRIAPRANLTPIERLAALTPWLARLAEPTLALRLRLKASVGARMARIFAIHDPNASSIEEAFVAAGPVVVDAMAKPRPAVNGAPMILPLTDTQRQQAWLAWAMLRAFDGGDEEARLAVRRKLGTDAKQWRATTKALGIDRPEAAVLASRQMRAQCPEIPTPHIMGADHLIRLGRMDEALEQIAALEHRWPDHRALARLHRISRYQPVAEPNE